MLPDRVSNPGPLTYESGALPIAHQGPVVQIFVSSRKGKVLVKDSFLLKKKKNDIIFAHNYFENVTSL